MPASMFNVRFMNVLWAGLCLIGLEHHASFAAPPPTVTIPPSGTMELPIAKTTSLYMVIDIPQKLGILKARGITLRTFPLQDIAWIGNPIPQPSKFSLTTKDPMIEPITLLPPPVPEKTAETTKEEDQPAQVSPPKAQTVEDMPSRYELVFDDRMRVMVQTHHLPSFWDNAFQQMANWTGRVAANFSTWKAAFGQPSQPYLVLSLELKDAQALYWAVFPPMPWLVLP